MKKEQKAKPAKAQRPVQREPKQVLTELLEKLSGKLEVKATSASPAGADPRTEQGPNLDRLTVGVDFGFARGDAKRRAATDEGSRSGRVLPGLTAGAGGDGSGDALCLDAGNHRGRGTRGGGGQPAADGGVETAEAQE